MQESPPVGKEMAGGGESATTGENAGEVATVRRPVGFLMVRGTGPVGSGLRAAGPAILANARTGASDFRAKRTLNGARNTDKVGGALVRGIPCMYVLDRVSPAKTKQP